MRSKMGAGVEAAVLEVVVVLLVRLVMLAVSAAAGLWSTESSMRWATLAALVEDSRGLCIGIRFWRSVR